MQLAEAFEPEQQATELVLPAKHTLNGIKPLLEDRGVEERLAAAPWRLPAVISPLCLEAVQRIDRLFDIERGINGCSADQRRGMRQQVSAALVADLHAWMRQQRSTLAVRRDRHGQGNGLHAETLAGVYPVPR